MGSLFKLGFGVSTKSRDGSKLEEDFQKVVISLKVTWIHNVSFKVMEHEAPWKVENELGSVEIIKFCHLQKFNMRVRLEIGKNTNYRAKFRNSPYFFIERIGDWKVDYLANLWSVSRYTNSRVPSWS